MKHRLYDFSPLMGTITLIVFALLLGITGCTMFAVDKPLISTILFCLLWLSLGALIWIFVVRAPRITPDCVTQGKKRFEKENVQYSIFYNFRFSEMRLRIRDKTIEYIGMDDKKAMKTKQIEVQATKQNLKKLGDWLGVEIDIPEEVKLRFNKGGKNK